MKNPLTFTAEIRQAVASCGLGQHELSRATGIDVASINRFIHGKSGLSESHLDTLAAFLDLHITTGKRSPANRKRNLPKKGR